MRFRLAPRSMTLDDIELYKFVFKENFAGFRRIRTQQQLNEYHIVSDNVVRTSNWSNFGHVFASRGFVSDSWAFLYIRCVREAISARRRKKLTVFNTLHCKAENDLCAAASHIVWQPTSAIFNLATDSSHYLLINRHLLITVPCLRPRFR